MNLFSKFFSFWENPLCFVISVFDHNEKTVSTPTVGHGVVSRLGFQKPTFLELRLVWSVTRSEAPPNGPQMISYDRKSILWSIWVQLMLQTSIWGRKPHEIHQNEPKFPYTTTRQSGSQKWKIPKIATLVNWGGPFGSSQITFLLMNREYGYVFSVFSDKVPWNHL